MEGKFKVIKNDEIKKVNISDNIFDKGSLIAIDRAINIKLNKDSKNLHMVTKEEIYNIINDFNEEDKEYYNLYLKWTDIKSAILEKFKNPHYRKLLKIIFYKINVEDLTIEQFEGFKELSELNKAEEELIEVISDFFYDFF